MNLYERVAQTEPGRHAHLLGELLYYWSSRLTAGFGGGPEVVQGLRDAQVYLEKLAFAELEREVPPWVSELHRVSGGGE